MNTNYNRLHFTDLQARLPVVIAFSVQPAFFLLVSRFPSSSCGLIVKNDCSATERF